MDKKAFIPYAPIPIKDKEEYYSDKGKLKREVNENISRATGAGIGLASGALAGLLAGQILGKVAPGKFGIPMRVFHSVGRRTGVPVGKEYALSTLAKTGIYPKSMPPRTYMPLLGAMTGAAAGIFPAEYKAKVNMEKSVGIDPVMTKKEFRHSDVYPTVGAVGLGVMASSLVDHILSTSTNKLTSPTKWYKNYPAMSALGAGLAVEVAAEKQLSKVFNKNKENTVEKEAQDIIQKIAEEAFNHGYEEEMNRLLKEAAECEVNAEKEDPKKEEVPKDEAPKDEASPEEKKASAMDILLYGTKNQ